MFAQAVKTEATRAKRLKTLSKPTNLYSSLQHRCYLMILILWTESEAQSDEVSCLGSHNRQTKCCGLGVRSGDDFCSAISVGELTP